MPQILKGPAALDAIAVAQEGHGLDVNASHFHMLAMQWHADLAYIEQLEAILDTAGKDPPARVLPHYAITPTDTRGARAASGHPNS